MTIEKRKYPRRELEDLSAKLYSPADAIEVDFCPLNVSERGFSILTSTPLSADSEYILALGRQDVRLVVRWCRSHDHDPAVFRCGLEALTSGDHLDELIKEELSYE